MLTMFGRVSTLLSIVFIVHCCAAPVRIGDDDGNYESFGRCGGAIIPEPNENDVPNQMFKEASQVEDSHNQTLQFRIKMWPTKSIQNHIDKSEENAIQYKEVVEEVVDFFKDLLGVKQHEQTGELNLSDCLILKSSAHILYDFLNETNDIVIPQLEAFDYHLVLRMKKCKSDHDGTTTLASAGPGCGRYFYSRQKHSITNKNMRPIVGKATICEGTMTGKPMQNLALQSTLKHELFHALGFLDLANPKKSGVTSEQNWQSIHGTTKRSRTIITHPTVIKAARAHFNCSTMQGPEVEDTGGSGTAGSHWERRHFGPEIMVGVISRSSYLSNVTLAFMASLGDKPNEEVYYPFVNYSKAENLWFGRNAGCRFVEGSCMDFIDAELQGKDKPRTPSFPLCSKMNVEAKISTGITVNLGTCSPDKRTVLKCGVNVVETVEQEEKWSFYYKGSSKLKRTRGSSEHMEYCPAFMDTSTDFKDTNCFNKYSTPTNSNNSGAEIFGADCRCVEQAEPFFTTDCNQPSFKSLMFGTGKIYSGFAGGGCYQYLCYNGRLLVQAAGDPKRYGPKVCWAPGTKILIRRRVGSAFTYGQLLCPKCEEICNAKGGYPDFQCLPPIVGFTPRDQLEAACTDGAVSPRTFFPLLLSSLMVFYYI